MPKKPQPTTPRSRPGPMAEVLIINKDLEADLLKPIRKPPKSNKKGALDLPLVGG